MRVYRRAAVAWGAVSLMGCGGGGGGAIPDARALRPATADVHFPTRLSLGATWEGERGASLQAAVRKKLGAVPARLVIVDGGASLTLSCSVASPSPNEVTHNTETTCTDNSGAGPVRYACVQSQRRVEVSIDVSVVLAERGSELFRTSLPFKTQKSTSVSIPKEQVPSGTSPAAPPIDVGKLYAELIAAAASRLVRVVAPYTEQLDKARLNCGTECEDGWRLVAACDYRGADEKFRKAEKKVDDDVQRSAAVWGRAVSHELLGDFDTARTLLERGQKLAPTHPEFGTELAELSERRAEADRLKKQGLARYNACSK
jgi:hypothetical protein